MTLISFDTLLAALLLLQFALKNILNLINSVLLLVQEIHDDAHGGLL